MKFKCIHPLVVAFSMSTTCVFAATPPPHETPQLKKADKPFIDLGNELGAGSPIVKPSKVIEQPTKHNSPKAQSTTQPTSQPAKAQTNSSTEHSDDKTHHAKWSYAGETGPKYWGDLSSDNVQCKLGKNQSPIDLRDAHATSTGGLDELQIRYRDVPLKIINNGHTVQVNYPLGSYIKLGNKRYELLQYHLHTPSEHKKEGFNYPMEMHLVHSDGDGNLAVIGIIFQEGEHNDALQMLLNHLPEEVNKQKMVRGVGLNPVMFLPGDTQFYKYSGSLTTPPCSEGVYWMVFKRTIEASAEQIIQMNEFIGDNNRPVQPINARDLLKSWSEQRAEPALYEFY